MKMNENPFENPCTAAAISLNLPFSLPSSFLQAGGKRLKLPLDRRWHAAGRAVWPVRHSAGGGVRRDGPDPRAYLEGCGAPAAAATGSRGRCGPFCRGLHAPRQRSRREFCCKDGNVHHDAGSKGGPLWGKSQGFEACHAS